MVVLDISLLHGNEINLSTFSKYLFIHYPALLNSQVNGSAANMLVYHLLAKHLLFWGLGKLDLR